MLYPTFFCRECGRDLTETIENTNHNEDTCESCKATEHPDQFKGIMGQSDLWGRE
ncbi:hypothetical protein [Alkalihalobacterium elongatum]|uniref:hypothetical protein n=1 Tax=Alkalihalobacterium elongatum TaxID=2675466 RepID=UPI001C1FB6A4|nr:hypothetical protein [Alkalihalobacterium elongatum]